MQTEVMPLVTGLPCNPDAEEYLEGLQELTQQLDRAMEAIVTRALSTLEDSLCRQRATCARMIDLSSHFVTRPTQSSTPGASVTSEPVPIEAELAGRITAAAKQLNLLNTRYSALLKHSGDTMQLFTRLFQSYSGSPHCPVRSQTNLHTWSCEL